MDYYDITIGGRKVQTTRCADVSTPANGQLAGVCPWRRLVNQERSGSALSIMRDGNLAEAVAGANDNPSGIGGSVWSSDMAAANEVASRLDDGSVWINGSI